MGGWRGFEQAPRGCLIHQLIDLHGEMGVAYERSLDFYKRPHVHDRDIFVFPRGGAEMDVTLTRDGRRFRVTGKDGLVVPEGVEHDDRAASFVYDTFALLPSASLVERTLGKRRLATGVFVRSPWLETLLEEYFAERVLGRARDASRGAHLEALIVIEVAESLAPSARRSEARVPPRVAGPGTLVGRALRFLEANLFAPVDLEKLARATGASRSSLLRHFRAETGLTPMQYVRARRLEDAQTLLRAGKHNVSEVATLVGYTSLGAFSEAYRARFGASPSGGR
jgi:AraC-like DNA-binding protein